MYILASHASLRSRVRLPAVPRAAARGGAARGGAARGRGAAGGFGFRVSGRSFGARARGARGGALCELRRPTRRDAFGRLLFRRLRVIRGFRVDAVRTAAAAERRPVRRRVVFLFRPVRVGARGGVCEGASAAVEALDRGMRPGPSRCTRRERVLFFFRRRLFFRRRGRRLFFRRRVRVRARSIQANDRRAPYRRGVFGSVDVFGTAYADRRGADAIVRFRVPRGRAARRGFLLLRGGQTADGGGRRRRRRGRRWRR